MNKYFLLFLLIATSVGFATAQCVIDTGITQTGITPPSDSLPCIIRDSPYNQTLQIRISSSLDTSYDGFQLSLKVYWVHVLTLDGLPPGINWSINPVGDTLPGGQSGCLTLSGTTTNTATGAYPIHAFVDAYVHIPKIPFYFPNGADTVFRNLDLTKISSPYNVFVINEGDSCPPKSVSGFNILGKETGIKVFPNPNNGVFEVVLNNANTTGQLSIFDVTGRTILTQPVNIGNSPKSIDLRTYCAGLYLLQVKTQNGIITEKILTR